MEPSRAPSGPIGYIGFQPPQVDPKAALNRIARMTQLLEETLPSFDSEEVIQMIRKASIPIRTNQLWDVVLSYARSDLKLATDVVKACPPTFRRDLVQTLLNFVLKKSEQSSSKAYVTLCEAEKINPQAMPRLLELLLTTPKFTFDYSQDIPALIELLDKGNFTPLDCQYLLAGMRYGAYPKDLENPLVDKLLKSDVIAQTEIKKLFKREGMLFRGYRLLWESASRFIQTGGVPPSSHYAELLLEGGGFASCQDSEHAAWLITPFHQTHPYSVGRYACSIIFLFHTEQLIPEVISRLKYEELFFFLEMNVCSLAERLLLERIFENLQLLLIQENWIDKLRKIIQLEDPEDNAPLINLEAFPRLFELLNFSSEEKTQINEALAAIRSTPGQNAKCV